MVVTLPEEMVRDILERLPAKSLMRFKCVHPSWKTLIETNHSFITVQTQRQIQNTTNERFMFFNRHNYATFYIWSHCNGVFCLSYYNDDNDDTTKATFLWNPCTKEVKHLPPPHTIATTSFFEEGGTGFGSDPNNTVHEFKVVEFCFELPLDPLRLSAEVYSSSTDSWTVLDVDVDAFVNPNATGDFFGFDQTDLDQCAYANGVYYWLSLDNSYILCFDFGLERFRKVYTPLGVVVEGVQPEESLFFGSIFEAHDSIAFTADKSFTIRAEIWILKQDDSWTKVCNTDTFYSFIDRIFAIRTDHDYGRFLARTRDGKLRLYNFNGQPIQEFENVNGGDDCFLVLKYVESIIPLSF